MYAEIVLDSRYFSNDTCAKLFSARPLRTCRGEIFSACPARALEDPVDALVVRRWMHHLGNHPISNQSSNQPPNLWVIYIFPHLLSLGSSATSKVLGRLWKIKRAEITHATLTERHSLKSTCVFFLIAITWQGLCMMISVSISMEFWHRMALAPFVCEPFQSVPFEPFQSVPFLKGTCSFACRVSFLFEQCLHAKQNWSAVIHHGYDGPCWFTRQGWRGLLETRNGAHAGSSKST